MDPLAVYVDDVEIAHFAPVLNREGWAFGVVALDFDLVGRRVATAGSVVHVERGSRLVVVTVRSPVRGPGGLFGVLPSFDVHAQAVAVREPER